MYTLIVCSKYANQRRVSWETLIGRTSLSPPAKHFPGRKKARPLLLSNKRVAALCLRSDPEAVACLPCSYQNRIHGSKMKIATGAWNLVFSPKPSQPFSETPFFLRQVEMR